MDRLRLLDENNKQDFINKDTEFWDTLSSEAYPITKGKLRIPICIEPFVLEKNKYETLKKDVELFVSAARKIADKFYEDEEIQKIIVIDDGEKKLIENSRNKDFLGIIRVDLFYGEEAKIVEINADFPDGFFMHDVSSQTMLTNFKNNNLSNPVHFKLFSELLIDSGANFDSNIFIGYEKDRFFVDEFYLTEIKLKKLGWKNIFVGAFEDLIYKDNYFYFNSKKIDVIRRGSELSKLRKNIKLINNLIEAQNNTDLIIINNFKMRLLGHKSLLAVLSDNKFHKYLNVDEINSVKKLLPETLKLNIENYNRVFNDKDFWVLKPSDLAEGEGVIIGSLVTNEIWKDALKKALINKDYWILQQKISIPSDEFNLYDNENGELKTVVRKYDFDPHVILFKNGSKLGNILSRFSESDVLNVMKGGGLTYVFQKNK